MAAERCTLGVHRSVKAVGGLDGPAAVKLVNQILFREVLSTFVGMEASREAAGQNPEEQTTKLLLRLVSSGDGAVTRKDEVIHAFVEDNRSVGNVIDPHVSRGSAR